MIFERWAPPASTSRSFFTPPAVAVKAEALHQALIAYSVVPTLRKPRRVGQPQSWRCKDGPAPKGRDVWGTRHPAVRVRGFQECDPTSAHPSQKTRRMGHPQLGDAGENQAASQAWATRQKALKIVPDHLVFLRPLRPALVNSPRNTDVVATRKMTSPSVGGHHHSWPGRKND